MHGLWCGCIMCSHTSCPGSDVHASSVRPLRFRHHNVCRPQAVVAVWVLKDFQLVVDARQENVMQGEHVQTIWGIQYSFFFKCAKQVIKQTNTPNKKISPEPLNSLILDAPSRNAASSARTMLGMTQHEFWYSDTPSSITLDSRLKTICCYCWKKAVQHCVSSIVSWSLKINW